VAAEARLILDDTSAWAGHLLAYNTSLSHQFAAVASYLGLAAAPPFAARMLG
jgi:hypothetical protein